MKERILFPSFFVIFKQCNPFKENLETFNYVAGCLQLNIQIGYSGYSKYSKF